MGVQGRKISEAPPLDTRSSSALREYVVPLERISESQLVLCHPERELLPLVLSHCHHTLRKGGETDSRYDLPAIQMQLVRRFLAGKPLIKEVNSSKRTPLCLYPRVPISYHGISKHICYKSKHLMSTEWKKKRQLESLKKNLEFERFCFLIQCRAPGGT